MVNRFALTAVGLIFSLALWFCWWWRDFNLPTGIYETASIDNKWVARVREKLPKDKFPIEQSEQVPIVETLAEREQIHFDPIMPNLSRQTTAVGQQLKPVSVNLHNQAPIKLWQYWLMQLKRAEFQQIPITGAYLAESLRKHSDPRVYEGIAWLLMQPDTATEKKAILLDLLAEIATPEALVQLLDLASRNPDSSVYPLVVQAISRIGDNRWDGRFHEELSPLLETAWVDPNIDEPLLLRAVGKAMAEVGGADGVNLLFLSLAGENQIKKPEETERPKREPDAIERIKQEVAFKVIPHVSNPKAVDVLSERLQQEPLGTPAFEVSGSALSSIGTPKATQKIVDWAQKAPVEGVRNLQSWLSKVDDVDSIQVIASAQKSPVETPEISAVLNDFVATTATGTVEPRRVAVPLRQRTIGVNVTRSKRR